MFAKQLLLAILSLSLVSSSFAVPADAFRGGKNDNSAQCATAVSTVTVTASAAAATKTNAAVSVGGKGGVGNTGNNNASGGKGAAGNNNASGGKGAAGNNAAATSSAAAAATSAAAGGGKGAGAGAGVGAGAGGDPQTSLTLDPSLICSNFASSNNNPPVDGQADSITSTNNFINFCLNKGPVTNGEQIKTGSCNPAPMGQIPSVDKMTSAKFQTPKNFDVIKSNTPFTISVATRNLQLGSFTNTTASYFSAPQTLNAQGVIIGHTHVTVEAISDFQQTTPTDPQVFAFFKGLNDAGVNGVVSADVTNGLPAGFYKASTINSAANHQPVLAPVAQHGGLDDTVYFAITDDGKPPAQFSQILGGAAAAAGGASGAAGAAAAASGKAATATAAPAAASSAAAAKGGSKFGGFKGGKVNRKRRAVF